MYLTTEYFVVEHLTWNRLENLVRGVGIALLLNFLPPESERDSKPLSWSHQMLTVHLPAEIALLQPLKEILLVTKCLSDHSEQAQASLVPPLGLPRWLHPSPVPGIYCLCLHSPALTLNLHDLLSPVSSVPGPLVAPIFSKKIHSFPDYKT